MLDSKNPIISLQYSKHYKMIQQVFKKYFQNIWMTE